MFPGHLTRIEAVKWIGMMERGSSACSLQQWQLIVNRLFSGFRNWPGSWGFPWGGNQPIMFRLAADEERSQGDNLNTSRTLQALTSIHIPVEKPSLSPANCHSSCGKILIVWPSLGWMIDQLHWLTLEWWIKYAIEIDRSTPSNTEQYPICFIFQTLDTGTHVRNTGHVGN